MLRTYYPDQGTTGCKCFASRILPRTSYDECVDWICNLLDEAASSLPAIRTNKEDYGLATSVGAKAVKAKMLLYAASPLFNGNSSFYSNFTDKSGSQLMPLTYDPNKWVKAKTAIKEAIDLAEQNGHALYVKQDYKIGNEDAEPYPAGRSCPVSSNQLGRLGFA